jgi:hypothetical protein
LGGAPSNPKRKNPPKKAFFDSIEPELLIRAVRKHIPGSQSRSSAGY